MISNALHNYSKLDQLRKSTIVDCVFAQKLFALTQEGDFK